MRRTVPLLLLAATTIVGMWVSVQPAAAGRYCLQGRQWGYPGNCNFATYGQCMASASGTDSSCGINPRHAYARHRR